MEGVQGGFFSFPRKAPRGTGDGRGRYLISKRHSTGMSCPRDGSVDRARERAPLLPFHGTIREPLSGAHESGSFRDGTEDCDGGEPQYAET